jgi:hypothetical protein
MPLEMPMELTGLFGSDLNVLALWFNMLYAFVLHIAKR